MPIAAIIDDTIFCCHGGLSPELTFVNEIKEIIRPTDVPEQGMLCDILWSDPNKEIIDDYFGEKWKRNKYNLFKKMCTKIFEW